MAKKQPKATFELREDQRKEDVRFIIARFYEQLSLLDDLYDAFKVDDHKRTVNSFKVEMIRTVIQQHRDNISVIERVYTQIGIVEVIPVIDNTEHDDLPQGDL
jgi:hypothetical protein